MFFSKVQIEMDFLSSQKALWARANTFRFLHSYHLKKSAMLCRTVIHITEAIQKHFDNLFHSCLCNKTSIYDCKMILLIVKEWQSANKSNLIDQKRVSKLYLPKLVSIMTCQTTEKGTKTHECPSTI